MSDYEQDQQQLRDEYEGNTQEIKIEASEPEVNPEIYRDVESMLFRGFLVVRADINEVPFIFKSLNHHEFELLGFMGAEGPNFWGYFLAYSTFMVRGVNILPDRERWIPELVKTYDGIVPSAKAKLIRQISAVNRRASMAVPLTEAYAMESISRYRWLQMQGMDLTSISITGIDGTHRLGMNWAQHLWKALNHAEDRHTTHEHEWENAKFIGSCFAGKGITKVYNRDNDRRAKEKAEKLSRKDRVIRENVLLEKFEDMEGLDENGYVRIRPRTVQELTQQLERDLKGEKDWHDTVVAAHEERIRAGIRASQQQLAEADKAHETEFEGKRLLGGSTLKGLTGEQVASLMGQRRQLEAQAASRMMTRPQARPLDDRAEKFLNHWGLDQEVTSEVSTTDRDPSEAVPVPPPRTPSTPFGKK